jgi:cell division protease FtsH
MTPEEDRFLMTKNQLVARIIGYLGGRTSEEIFFGDVSTGAQNDIEVATRIARMMVTEYGMSELGPIQYESNTGSVFLGRDYNSTQKNFSTQIAFEIDTEVRKIIDNAHEEARKILTKHKDQVIQIAKRLLDKETITSEEIQSLIHPEPTKDEAKEDKDVVKKPRAKKGTKGDA